MAKIEGDRSRFGMAFHRDLQPSELLGSIATDCLLQFRIFMFILKGNIVVRRRGRCVGPRKTRISEGFCLLDGDTVWRASGGIPCNERGAVKSFFADKEFLFAFGLLVPRTR